MRPLRIKLDVSVLYIAFSSPRTCKSNPDCLSRSKIIYLSTLSKAFCMSMRHMCSSCPPCARICESSSSERICSVQLLPLLKPACSSESRWFYSRWVRSLAVISLSMTLSHTFISDIGLCACGDLSPPFLGIRQIKALLKSSGISLVVHICCTNDMVMSSAVLPPFLSSSAEMLSGPGAFLFARACSTFVISSSVGASPHVVFGSSAGSSCC